jgi:hypothetical protein
MPNSPAFAARSAISEWGAHRPSTHRPSYHGADVGAVGGEDVLAPGTVLTGVVDVVPPGVDVEVLLLPVVVVVDSVVVVGPMVVLDDVGGAAVDVVVVDSVVVGHVVVVVDGGVVVDVVGDSVVVAGGVVVVDVAVGSVVVVHGTDVVGGDVVGPTVGVTSGTGVDVVDVDEVVVVVEVVLVDELVVTADCRRPTFAVGAFSGRGGSEDVGGDGVTAGTDVVVVPAVDVVIKTSEVGPTRSGIRPSLPWIDPTNSVTATTPVSTSTTPLDAAMIVDRWCRHPGAVGSYSGMTSVSNSHAAPYSSASSTWSNEIALDGSGGGHIPNHFHLAGVPIGRTIRHSLRWQLEDA